MNTEEKFELDFEKLREDVDLIQLNGELIGYRAQIARLRIAIESIANERDLYAASAITIAAAHKVERDELTAERDLWKARCEFSFEQRDFSEMVNKGLSAGMENYAELEIAARLALYALSLTGADPDDSNYEECIAAIAALKAILK